MERLWAPWRSQYIQSSSSSTRSEADAASACFLCQILLESEDRANLLVQRRAHSMIVLNRYPYNNGHLLIAPLVHVGRLEELRGPDLTEPVETMAWVIGVLNRLLRPHGYNVGLNLGRAAGAGLPGHLHWHVVPRWDGDTNFMPVLGGTKVIVESLAEFYDRLSEEISRDIPC